MSEQYVYRYNDVNRAGDGYAQVELLRRVIIKETEHYVWSVPEPMIWQGVREPLASTEWYFKRPKYDYNHPKKTKKNADRSAWHITKEQAMAAWFIRKQHQLSRLKLALERVELCVEGVKTQGVLRPASYDTARGYVPLKVKQTPDTVECGAGPVLSEYNWTEI
jgi:hypothetical protein